MTSLMRKDIKIFENVVTVPHKSIEFQDGRYERAQWIKDNCVGRHEEIFGMNYYFEDKEDAFRFKMIWG